MPKINKNKSGIVEVTFSEEEIGRVKKAAGNEADELLMEKYTVVLPLYAIKLLMETVADQVKEYDYLAVTCGVSGRDDLRSNAASHIGNSLVDQLNKLGVNGDAIADEIIAKAERRWKVET